MRHFILCVALMSGIAIAHSRPANDEELALIRSVLEVDQFLRQSRLELLEVGGNVLDGGASGVEYVTGWAWFRPFLVHDKLCLAQQLIQRAHRTASGYDWRPKENEYRYWIVSSASDCEVDDASMIPSDAILGQSTLPTAELIDILDGEADLLQAAFQYVLNESNWETVEAIDRNRQIERFDGYLADPTFRITLVGMSREARPDYGIVFYATYGGAGHRHGLELEFSIVRESFNVHEMRTWIMVH
jgi:hypothetical protein